MDKDKISKGMTEDHSDLNWALIKVAFIWFVSLFAHNYHIIAGNILVTLSIAYLIWKWRRDIKKEKLGKP